MKQQIENIIKKNLPEKKVCNGDDYLKKEGWNFALSQINTSLITDKVLKVVVENERNWIEDNWINFYESSKPLAEWEYCEHNNLSTEKRLDFLNKMGQLGWELCLVRGGNNYIFKRPLLFKENKN